ncbi:Phenylacetyl-CoA ligase [Mycena kentingensis (nom. inval.)]|nr:Phenylacetyl-CoA ligase [Mycena kentingensis (nom. inval.)]
MAIDIRSPSTVVLPPIPDNLTIPHFFLDHHHSGRPKRLQNVPCLIEDESGRKIYFDELRERTQSLANALSTEYAIGDEDIVLLFSRNHVDYVVAIWAVHRLGGIISPANPDFNAHELEYQLNATKAKLIIVHPESVQAATAAAKLVGLPLDRMLVFDVDGFSAPKSLITVNSLVKKGAGMKAVPERTLKPGEGKTKLALLSFSSGTTGRPKAVAIPHIGFIANLIQLAAHARINEDYCDWKDRRYRPGDVALGVLPLYHIYGLVVSFHFMLYCGMAVVVVPKFNFERMLKSIVRHKITHLLYHRAPAGDPSLQGTHFLLHSIPSNSMQHATTKNYDLGGVRYIMIGAAPVSEELNQMLIDLFPDAHIGQGWGMTETCTVGSIWGIEKKRGVPGSAGQLLPGGVARILKADGTYGGYNEIGELIWKSPSNALRYHNNPEATKETFIDGFVRTGDEVKITPDGELFIVDRIKEIMKVRGFQVAPSELEGALLDHPDVGDVCVVGVPDEYSGEVPLAFVVLSAKAAKRAKDAPQSLNGIRAGIIKYIADNKIHYKQLAGGVEFLDVIPRNPSGKLLRRVLREQAKELKKKGAVKTAKAKL